MNGGNKKNLSKCHLDFLFNFHEQAVHKEIQLVFLAKNEVQIKVHIVVCQNTQ